MTKIVVAGTGPKAGRWFLRSLPGLKPLSNDPACLRSSFGTLGTLEVSEVLKIDFVFAPTAEAARPLWRPFLSSALGVLMLEDSEPVMKLARYCAFELRLPLVIAAGAASGGLTHTEVLPTSLRGAPGGSMVISTDASHAVRTLLLAALRGPVHESPEALAAQPDAG